MTEEEARKDLMRRGVVRLNIPKRRAWNFGLDDTKKKTIVVEVFEQFDSALALMASLKRNEMLPDYVKHEKLECEWKKELRPPSGELCEHCKSKKFEWIAEEQKPRRKKSTGVSKT